MVLDIILSILVWGVIFSVAMHLLAERNTFKDKIEVKGLSVTWNSKYGLGYIGSLAERLSEKIKVWGDIGILFSYFGIVISSLLIFSSSAIYLYQGQKTGVNIEERSQALLIPRVSDFLPLSMVFMILISLIIGMVVHEFGHALLSRVGGIRVEETGLFFFSGILMGAFVRPNEDDIEESDRRTKLRMYSAGITNNIAVAALCILVLLIPFGLLLSTVSGAPLGAVFVNSPAAEANLGQGDVITSIEGEGVNNTDEARNILDKNNDKEIELALKDGQSTTIEKETFVTSKSRSVKGLNTGDVITHIGDSRVKTEESLRKAIEKLDETRTIIRIEEGRSAYLSVGIKLTVGDSTPLNNLGISQNEDVLIRKVDGEVFTSPENLRNYISSQEGDRISLTISNGQETQRYTTQASRTVIEENMSVGIFGVSTTDHGIIFYPTESHLDILTIGGEYGPLEKIVSILMLPFASLAGEVSFVGFTSSVQNIYTVSYIPQRLHGIWFTFGSLLFWLSWVNINLAVFNCLPTYLLDGGYVLRESINSLFDFVPFLEPSSFISSSVNHFIKLSVLVTGIYLIVQPLI